MNNIDKIRLARRAESILLAPGGYVIDYEDDANPISFEFVGDTEKGRDGAELGGNVEKCRLLYAMERDDGLFDVAALASKSGVEYLALGVLDHVPIEGEHVIGWVHSSNDTFDSTYIGKKRAEDYVNNNDLAVGIFGFVNGKDSGKYCQLDANRASKASANSKFVVCGLGPGDIVRSEEGRLFARVPCDMEEVGKAWISVDAVEVIDDRWHDDKKPSSSRTLRKETIKQTLREKSIFLGIWTLRS